LKISTIFFNEIFTTNFSTFLNSTSFAQIQQSDSIHISSVEKQGSIMTKLFLAKDYKEFVKYVYQPSIDVIGGKEKMIELIQESVNQLATNGFYITNCSVEKPEKIIYFKNELQCTFVEYVEMKVYRGGRIKGRLISKSILIGISKNNGEDWSFIETLGRDLKTLQRTFNDLSDNLVIAEETEPIFYRE
jgi:hypothetical protein